MAYAPIALGRGAPLALPPSQRCLAARGGASAQRLKPRLLSRPRGQLEPAPGQHRVLAIRALATCKAPPADSRTLRLPAVATSGRLSHRKILVLGVTQGDTVLLPARLGTYPRCRTGGRECYQQCDTGAGKRLLRNLVQCRLGPVATERSVFLAKLFGPDALRNRVRPRCRATSKNGPQPTCSDTAGAHRPLRRGKGNTVGVQQTILWPQASGPPPSARSSASWTRPWPALPTAATPHRHAPSVTRRRMRAVRGISTPYAIRYPQPQFIVGATHGGCRRTSKNGHLEKCATDAMGFLSGFFRVDRARKLHSG